jgi:hypothetical protein
MQSAIAVLVLLLTTVGASPSGWRVAASLPGVFDVAGPRRDGKLVVAGAQGLALLDPRTGSTQPFAPAYGPTGTAEAYIAVAPAGQPCFGDGAVYALSTKLKGGVARVGVFGDVRQFAVVPRVDGLSGIAFDTAGRFGHRLLVFGGHAGRTTIAALDCRGAVSVITTQAPIAEGGAAVAPASFGAFAGDLVLTDELSGLVFAVAPDGQVRQVATPPLPHGGDIGVEGAGFVPPGDVAGDQVLFADRATAGSPHPGSDYLLAAPGGRLAAAGVRPGDLLVATEGGAALDAIHCAASCSISAVIAPNGVSHGEGHVLVVTAPALSAAPRSGFGEPAPGTPPVLQVVLLALIAAAIALLALRLRARRGSRSARP